MGSGTGIARMDGSAVNEMIAPHASTQKRPRDGAADSAGIVSGDEISRVLWGDAGRFRVIPAPTNLEDT